MERYLGYILNVVAGADDGRLQPLYGIGGRSVIDRADDRLAPRLSRHGARAGRQSGVPAGAARRVRLGHPGRHPRVFRPPAGPSGRRGRCSTAWRRSASARRAVFDQPDAGHLGAARRRPACIRSPASCAGPRATAWPDRHAPRARGAAPRTGASHAARIHRVICERCWNPERNPSWRRWTATRSMPACCARTEVGFLPEDDPRFVGHGACDRARPAPGATSCSATWRRTTSASRRTRSWCARSGTSTRWRRWAGGTRPARCSRRCSRAGTGTAYWQSMSIPARGSRGATSSDLQHGRAHQLRDPAFGSLGSGILSASRRFAPLGKLRRSLPNELACRAVRATAAAEQQDRTCAGRSGQAQLPPRQGAAPSRTWHRPCSYHPA